MSNGRVYEVEGIGWVAADDGGWLPGVFDTEADARAVIEMYANLSVSNHDITEALAEKRVNDYRTDLRAKVGGLRDEASENYHIGPATKAVLLEGYDKVLALLDGSRDD